LALGFWVSFGGRPASAAEESLGAVVELDSGCLSQGQQLAAKVDQIMSIRLLNRLKTRDVGTKVSDSVTLLGVLGFEPVNVYSLSSELVAEGILAISAGGQISS
jgi:hypothetical protein